MRDQDFEQGKLAGGERGGDAVLGEGAGSQIDHHAAKLNLALLAGCTRRQRIGTPPHDGVDAGNELARVEGLGQVVVRAHFEADNTVDVLAFGGKHDDGHHVLGTAQATAYRQTIFARHHQVQDQQVKAFAHE